MERFVDLTLGGVSSGFATAAIALSLVLIWRSTHILNFAQGGMALICAYIAYSVTQHSGSYWAGFAAAIGAGIVLGGLVERVLIRLVENKPPLNAVIVTLGLFILLEGLAGMIYGVGQRSFGYGFDFHGYTIGSHRVAFAPADMFAVLSVIGVAAAILLVFRYTAVGLRMRAAAFAPEVARMLGVRVGRTLTLGWALAGGVGALAGMLTAPPFLSPNALDLLFVSGFTAAVIGGLDSAIGAIVGGLILGLALSYISGYATSNLSSISSFGILVAVLLVRPSGLFGHDTTRRV